MLLIGATAPLAACTVFEGAPDAAPTPSAPHPDDVLRDRVAAHEEQLLAWYGAVAAEHPELAQAFEPFRRHHERHLAALLATAPPPDPAATPGAATATPPPKAALPPVAADPAEAVGQLTEAEAAAAGTRLADCVDARDGGLARVLAGIAACEASHGRLLRSVPT